MLLKEMERNTSTSATLLNKSEALWLITYIIIWIHTQYLLGKYIVLMEIVDVNKNWMSWLKKN